MSRRRAEALTQRQQQLLVRSVELRLRLGGAAAVWQPPLAWADQVHAAWRWLRLHPEVPLAAAVMLAVLRPRRALRWAGRAWWAWRLWQRLQRGLGRAIEIGRVAAP